MCTVLPFLSRTTDTHVVRYLRQTLYVHTVVALPKVSRQTDNPQHTSMEKGVTWQYWSFAWPTDSTTKWKLLGTIQESGHGFFRYKHERDLLVVNLTLEQGCSFRHLLHVLRQAANNQKKTLDGEAILVHCKTPPHHVVVSVPELSNKYS